MADVTHKVTWFFEGKNRGWTESLWLVTGLDHESTYKTARNLALRRALLLGLECSIKAIRVSSEGTGPDALLRYEDIQPHQDVEDTAAHPDVGVLIRCNNVGDSRWKHIFLRGIWDKVEDNFGNYKRTHKRWRPLMDEYLQTLVADKWCWMGVVPGTKVKVTGYTLDANDRITYQFASDIFPADLPGKNAHVRLSGVNGKGLANGYFPVEVLTRSSCITVAPRAAGLYRYGGFGVYSTLAPIGIAKAIDQKTCERKSGAPLLEQRGRAKARPRT